MSRNQDVPEALFLLGEEVRVLHWLPGDKSAGRDIDCAVRKGDPNWWLRLHEDWRLCQALWHDVGSTYWIIDNGRRALALDALEDHRGLGKDGFPTDLAFAGGSGPWSPGPARAVYLTAKRLRKHQMSSHQWDLTRLLAREDEAAYTAGLRRVFSDRTARRLADTVLVGQVPPAKLSRQARISHTWRRFARGSALTVTVPLALRRLLARVFHPTGLIVLLVGPDGTGKSTLVHGLAEECHGLFRRQMAVHWRPGLLPRLGAIMGRQQSDASTPHAQRPHSRLTSHLVLAYYWLDFLVGGWFRIWPQKTRTGLVLWERGWWDMEVDPTRYRLEDASTLLRMLGRVVPHPDLTVVLEAPAGTLLGRKQEVPGTELMRQTEAWRRLKFPAAKRVLRVDASSEQPQVLAQVRQEIVSLLEERTLSRLGKGWMSFSIGSAHLVLPRGPRKIARASLLVYQPLLPRAYVAWHLTRLAAGLGALKLTPRADVPPRNVRQLIAPYLRQGGSFALSKGNGPGRFSALLFDGQHNPYAWAKLRTDSSGVEELALEGNAIRRFGPQLPSPLYAPDVLDEAEGILLLRFLPWQARRRPWLMDVDVATALGGFFRRGVASGSFGFVHGDCAPWNLLRTSSGWCLVDWEMAVDDGPPFFDLFHYLFRSHALLGRPDERELLEGLTGNGWIGDLVKAYARGAGVNTRDVPERFHSYLTDASSQSSASHIAGGREIQDAGNRLKLALSSSP
jgi:Phosphotransferase enzyme family